MINAVSEQIAAQITPYFFVKIEQRVYITSPEDDSYSAQTIVPDVYLVHESAANSQNPAINPITTPTLIEPLTEIIYDRFLEIRTRQSHEVVTTLEVLSPFNKTSGPGQAAFLHKRQQVMASNTHWIELDLLRAGERPAVVRGQSDYYALLKRAGIQPFEVWFTNLRDSLPTIAVPLRPPFADAPLDLQAAFATVYARGYYAASLDYTAPIPHPPLRPADAHWATNLLQAASRSSQSFDET